MWDDLLPSCRHNWCDPVNLQSNLQHHYRKGRGFHLQKGNVICEWINMSACTTIPAFFACSAVAITYFNGKAITPDVTSYASLPHQRTQRTEEKPFLFLFRCVIKISVIKNLILRQGDAVCVSHGPFHRRDPLLLRRTLRIQRRMRMTGGMRLRKMRRCQGAGVINFHVNSVQVLRDTQTASIQQELREIEALGVL